MTEEEYFKLLGGIETVEEKKEEEKPEPLKKPVYVFDRNNTTGKVEVNTPTMLGIKQEKKEKSITEQNNEIINNSMRNKKNIVSGMLRNYNNELAKIQIEIELEERLYSKTNDEKYKTNLNDLNNQKIELIEKIKGLNLINEE
jgi:hypothetical protein